VLISTLQHLSEMGWAAAKVVLTLNLGFSCQHLRAQITCLNNTVASC